MENILKNLISLFLWNKDSVTRIQIQHSIMHSATEKIRIHIASRHPWTSTKCILHTPITQPHTRRTQPSIRNHRWLAKHLSGQRIVHSSLANTTTNCDRIENKDSFQDQEKFLIIVFFRQTVSSWIRSWFQIILLR